MIKFLLANTLFPIAVALLLSYGGFAIPINFWVAVGSAILLFAANIYFFLTFAHHRPLIGAIALLNVAAFILFGDISFFTAMPIVLGLFLNGALF